MEALIHPRTGEELRSIKPVSPPPPHPGREHVIGNRVRWAMQVMRYMRYRRRTRQRPLF